MTQSTFKERLARLAPTQVTTIDRVTGSPAVIHLTCEDRSAVQAVTAAQELARRGLSLLRAKRVVEAALAGMVAVRLPAVEDRQALAAALTAAGLRVRFLAEDKVDVRGLRERLALNREQFAWRFNLSVDTVEKWELGERQPDAGSLAYLRVIARDPEAAIAAQET